MAHVLLQQDRWIVQLRVGEGPEGEAQKLRSFVLVKKNSWHVCDKSRRDEISTSNLYAKRANLCMASLKVSFSAGSTKKNPRSGVNHAKDRWIYQWKNKDGIPFFQRFSICSLVSRTTGKEQDSRQGIFDWSFHGQAFDDAWSCRSASLNTSRRKKEEKKLPA